MYSEQDLNEAVQAGAITAQNAAALREFVAARRQLPAVDEEYVRLLSGFNDIFVSIAIALVGIATFVLAGDAWSRGLAMAAEAWVMAEYFTRRRRMALPSILLLLLYAQGVALLLMHVIGVYVADHLLAFLPYGRVGTKSGLYLTTGFTAGFEALAIYAHWWRFKVPITVAAGCGALVGLVVFLALGFAPGLLPYWPWLMIAGGLAVFAVALWWDMSDRARITRRADVAFWLHLLAAPMLVHPAFYLLGLLQGGGDAAMAVALYAVLAMVALLVDRRALLVSALGYVIYALAHVLRQSGSEAQSLAVTALIAGCALLLLSAFWHRVRAALLRLLPVSLTAKLPA